MTDNFHSRWKLSLLHTTARYRIVCPAYVLMPDHVHLILLGLEPHGSDQRLAVHFLRKNLVSAIAPLKWQRQPYDHVLTESERAHGAFVNTAEYLFENPVRAGLAPTWRTYRFHGCCIPGYPEFDPATADYWERFWRCYNYLIEKQRV